VLNYLQKSKYLGVRRASLHGNTFARQSDSVVPGKRTVLSVEPCTYHIYIVMFVKSHPFEELIEILHLATCVIEIMYHKQNRPVICRLSIYIIMFLNLNPFEELIEILHPVTCIVAIYQNY
jgi:hypothetical protein